MDYCMDLSGDSNQEGMSVHYCCQDKEVLIKSSAGRSDQGIYVD